MTVFETLLLLLHMIYYHKTNGVLAEASLNWYCWKTGSIDQISRCDRADKLMLKVILFPTHPTQRTLKKSLRFKIASCCTSSREGRPPGAWSKTHTWFLHGLNSRWTLVQLCVDADSCLAGRSVGWSLSLSLTLSFSLPLSLASVSRRISLFSSWSVSRSRCW